MRKAKTSAVAWNMTVAEYTSPLLDAPLTGTFQQFVMVSLAIFEKLDFEACIDESVCLSLSVCLSVCLTHTHTHTHTHTTCSITRSLIHSLTHTHTHTLSLSLSL